MPILVSCWHCKRAVLMAPRLTERELVWLWDHLGGCAPDDPSIGLGVEKRPAALPGGRDRGERGNRSRGAKWRAVCTMTISTVGGEGHFGGSSAWRSR